MAGIFALFIAVLELLTRGFFMKTLILNMLDKLWVEEGEASKLILVEVHHEQLVGGGEVCTLTGELSVKIGHILPVFLK